MTCPCNEATPLVSRLDDSDSDAGGDSSESPTICVDNNEPLPLLQFGFAGLDESAAPEVWKKVFEPLTEPEHNVVHLGVVFHLAYQGFPWSPTPAYKGGTPAYGDGEPAQQRRYGGLVYLSWSEIDRKKQSLPQGSFVSFHISETDRCHYVSKLLTDDPDMQSLIETLVERYSTRHVHLSGPDLFEDPKSVAAMLRVCAQFPTVVFVIPFAFFRKVHDAGPIPRNLCPCFDESAGVGKEASKAPEPPPWLIAGSGSCVALMGGLDATNVKEWLDCYAHFAAMKPRGWSLISNAMSGFRQDRKRSEPIDDDELLKLQDSVRGWAKALAKRRADEQKRWVELKCLIQPWGEFLLHKSTLDMADSLVSQLPPRRVMDSDFALEAVEAIVWVTPVLWLFALLYPFWVFQLSDCRQATALSAGEQPIAKYPAWVWLIFLPVVGYASYSEAQALRWILCTHVMYETPFRCLRIKCSGMTPWLVFTATTSLAAKLDIPNNGLFLARLLITLGCADESSGIRAAWYRTVQGSFLLRWVPRLDQLETVLLLGWGLMLLQPLVLIAYSPLERLRDEACKRQGHSTLLGRFMRKCHEKEVRVSHADMLRHLGTVNRMVSITDGNVEWTIQRACEVLHTKKLNRCSLAIDMVKREIDRTAIPVMVLSLCRAIMMELQFTMLASDCFLKPAELKSDMDWQMLLSVVISVFTFLKSCEDSVSPVMLIRRILSLVDNSKKWGDIQQSDEENQEIEERKRVLQTTKRRTCLGVFVLCMTFMHCSTLFVHKYIPWVLPSFTEFDGVDRKICTKHGGGST